MTNQKPTIIFLHGTMGSVLRKDGVRVWPIVNSKITDPNHYKNALTPVSDIDGIEAYSSLFTYIKFIKELQLHGYKVIDRNYDWRKNNLDHLNILLQDIEKIDSDNIIIIAHSMGGIIAKLTLNKFKDNEAIKKVKKLITIGTPWKGSMSSIRFLKYGAAVPEMNFANFIDAQSSKYISSFFPSVYQLLPTQAYFDHLKKNHILPCSFEGDYHYEFEKLFKLILQKEFNKNHKYIDVFDEYYSLLENEIPGYIEHHELIGTALPTMSVISEKSNKEPHALWDDGDGTVPVFSSFTNSSGDNYFPYFFRKTKHNFFTNYPKVSTLIKKIISGKRIEHETSELFFSLSSPYYKKFQGYIQKVACPVEVSITNNEGLVVYGNIDSISEEEIRESLQTETNVNTLGNTTYIIYDEEIETDLDNFQDLIIEAYDSGPTAVSIDKFEAGEIVQRNAFNTFEISPYKTARVSLDRDLDNTTLELHNYKEDKKEIIASKNIEFREDKLTLPTTHIKIDSPYLIEHSGAFFIKSQLQLTVEKVDDHTFNTGNTYVHVNEKIYKLTEGDTILLDSSQLRDGFNLIQYYTVDEFENTEKTKEIEVHFIEKSYNLIKIKFDYRHYIVSAEENPYYQRMIERLSLGKHQPQFTFDDEDGVTGYDIVYRNKKRSLEVKLVDIFDDVEEYNIDIDEKLVKKVIRGTASTTDVDKLVTDFKFSDPKYKFVMVNTGNKGKHTLLKQKSLDTCTGLKIYGDLFEIVISKDVSYDVKFEVLTEQLNLGFDNKYNFTFTVLDEASNEFINDLNLYCNFSFKINKEIFEDDFEILFNKDMKNYFFTLDLEKARNFINEFWEDKQKSISDAKIDIKSMYTNISIRELPLFIKTAEK